MRVIVLIQGVAYTLDINGRLCQANIHVDLGAPELMTVPDPDSDNDEARLEWRGRVTSLDPDSRLALAMLSQAEIQKAVTQ